MNGALGAETELTVLSFQQERNLSPATIATPATLAALENGLAGRVAVPAVGISSSFHSPRSSIQQLQTRLQGKGFYTGSVSGVFDAPTRDALDQASTQLQLRCQQ